MTIAVATDTCFTPHPFWGTDLKYKNVYQMLTVARRVKLIFTGGHISLTVAFKGPNVILGLYKCNYS